MIFPLVLAGHLIGDWVVQTDWQANAKIRSWRANQQHMIGYHATMAAFVLPAWHTWATLVLFGVSWITHSIIDRRWPVRELLLRTGSKDFAGSPWGILVVDQALHLSILAVLVAGLKGS